MTTKPRALHLNLFLRPQGDSSGAWRHEGSNIEQFLDPEHFINLAQRAEQANFDAIFLADGLALGQDSENARLLWAHEPLTLLSAIAARTQHIGLVATLSTTYTEPYNAARYFAGLDRISHGRAGWNIVTGSHKEAAANFGGDPFPDHDARYERAEEFVDVVKQLWRSWPESAFAPNRTKGRLLQLEDIHPINHTGAHFSVRGPAVGPGPRAGRPFLMQAGTSPRGIAFGGAHADAVFTGMTPLNECVRWAEKIRDAAVAAGRPRRAVKVMPVLSPYLGSTQAEAERRRDAVDALRDAGTIYVFMNEFFGVDVTHLDIDAILRPADLPNPETVNGLRSRYAGIYDLVQATPTTLRQVGRWLDGTDHTVTGTPEQIADLVADYFEAGAADGFNLIPPYYDEQFDLFITEVIPLLQQRGIFRHTYDDDGLIDRFND